jgi:hypothetical protein
MDAELERLHASTGRPSIAPERLLRAALLMVLYSIRSERQLMEQMNDLSIAACNLVRMRRLIPIQALAAQGRSVSGTRENGLQT